MEKFDSEHVDFVFFMNIKKKTRPKRYKRVEQMIEQPQGNNKFKYENRHFHPPTAGARRPDLHYVAFCSTQGQEPLVRARVAVEELFVRETDSLVLS